MPAGRRAAVELCVGPPRRDSSSIISLFSRPLSVATRRAVAIDASCISLIDSSIRRLTVR